MTELENKRTNRKAGAAHHATHTDDLQRLKRVKGQIEGIEKMVLDGRYCPDILMQVKAAGAALKSVELSILERHIRHCLAAAVESGSKRETERKIEEIITILSRKS